MPRMPYMLSNKLFSRVSVEFVTVLANKQVKTGGEIILRCEANLENLTATWEKDDNKLICVDGKHIINKNGRSYEMTIKNAEEGDEGKYTIHLKNSSGSISWSAMVTVELNEWRRVQWKQDQLISTLKTFKPTNDKVKEFRFLLYGPIGAGKSAIVNTLKSILEGRMYVICPTASEVTKSYTSKYEKYQIGNAQDGLSLTFSDTMGVELGEGNGVHIDDIISTLKGHILEGYTGSIQVVFDDESGSRVPTDKGRSAQCLQKLEDQAVKSVSAGVTLGVPET
ncbi:hypothetical protein NFI96_029760, partial [Prochilodus magdalenae]